MKTVRITITLSQSRSYLLWTILVFIVCSFLELYSFLASDRFFDLRFHCLSNGSPGRQLHPEQEAHQVEPPHPELIQRHDEGERDHHDDRPLQHIRQAPLQHKISDYQ